MTTWSNTVQRCGWGPPRPRLFYGGSHGRTASIPPTRPSSSWGRPAGRFSYKLFGITISRVGLLVTIEAGWQHNIRARKRYYEKREHMTAIHWARYPQV